MGGVNCSGWKYIQEHGLTEEEHQNWLISKSLEK